MGNSIVLRFHAPSACLTLGVLVFSNLCKCEPDIGCEKYFAKFWMVEIVVNIFNSKASPSETTPWSQSWTTRPGMTLLVDRVLKKKSIYPVPSVPLSYQCCYWKQHHKKIGTHLFWRGPKEQCSLASKCSECGQYFYLQTFYGCSINIYAAEHFLYFV